MEVGLLFASTESSAATANRTPGPKPAAEAGFEQALQEQLARASGREPLARRNRTSAVPTGAGGEQARTQGTFTATGVAQGNAASAVQTTGSSPESAATDEAALILRNAGRHPEAASPGAAVAGAPGTPPAPAGGLEASKASASGTVAAFDGASTPTLRAHGAADRSGVTVDAESPAVEEGAATPTPEPEVPVARVAVPVLEAALAGGQDELTMASPPRATEGAQAAAPTIGLSTHPAVSRPAAPAASEAPDEGQGVHGIVRGQDANTTANAGLGGAGEVQGSAQPASARVRATAADGLALRPSASSDTGGGESQPTPVAARDPDVAIRSLERLDAEFRGRLERVVERMRSEQGLEVRVVETYRGQERQDQLYAQGRSAPGPVVTWTRNSNHTRGLAADVALEGAASQDAAFRQLARVAAEEGLRTLGPDDPGHIEMPGTRAGTPSQEVAPALQAAAPVGVARVARIASPAAVAGIAQVATVSGSVAPPAPIGNARGGRTTQGVAAGWTQNAEGADPRKARPAPVSAPVIEPEVLGAERAAAAARGEAPAAKPGSLRVREAGVSAEAQPNGPSDVVRSKAAAHSAEPAAEGASSPSAGTSHPSGGAALPTGPAAPAGGVDIAGRVARVLMLREAASLAPVTGMTLTLDGAEGAAARIRLALRGSAVGGTIDVAGAVEAAELASRTGELQQAFERQGLESTLRVREAVSALPADSRVPAIDSGGVWLRSAADDGRRTSQEGSHSAWRDASTADTRQQRRNAKEERK